MNSNAGTDENSAAGSGGDAEETLSPIPPVQPPSPAGRPEPLGPTRRLIRNGLAVLVVVVAVVVAGVFGSRAYFNSVTERATSDAVAAATTRTAQLLSYSAPTLDADLARAKQQVTGDFVTRFNQLASTLIGPSTKEQNITTKATVTRAGFVSADSNRVVTLVFIDQVTTTATRPAPVQSTSQAQVTMTKVGGTWLISDVAPI
jgi:Mce-associated membrane protein